MISNEVRGDKNKYSEAYLGRSNESYCNWIQSKDAWGGAIEVQILSEYFQVQIAVVDTLSGSVTVFGEGANFPTVMVLIYDGIHYDALFDRKSDGSEVTIHPSSDTRLYFVYIIRRRSIEFYFLDFRIIEKAKATAKEAKAAHNYTDTAGFTLK